MILSVEERVIILSLLPSEGSFATLKILSQLRMGLSFTEEELRKWEIVEVPAEGRITWRDDGEAEIPIGEKATDLIVDALKKRDREGKLPMQAMNVYEKFIPTTE
jgi:hypothetical protein